MPELDKLVTVKLDKERHLRLTLKGLLEFEKFTGKNLLRGLNLDDLSMEDSAVLLWASLVHEDPELTYDAILDMVDLSNIAAVMEAMTECLNKSFSEPEKASERPLAKRSRRG